MSDQVTEADRRAEAQVPSTFMEYVRAMGPGLLVAMAWLSAGDLVSASVSGSTYGYALIWALVLALFARFFFVSADRKSTRLNSSHANISYAVFCLKKKKTAISLMSST